MKRFFRTGQNTGHKKSVHAPNMYDFLTTHNWQKSWVVLFNFKSLNLGKPRDQNIRTSLEGLVGDYLMPNATVAKKPRAPTTLCDFI